MMRQQPLCRGPLVSLIRYDHPSDRPHRDPSEEVARYHSISFVERGGFHIYHGRNQWRMEPTTLFRADRGSACRERATLAGELLAALDSAAHDDRRLFRDGQAAWYARRVDAAREILSERFWEPHTLEGTAREVGMSPFHFSRVFRALIGVPPHRYLVQVRLGRAAQRLKQGVGVTETCYATGFNNLSHFHPHLPARVWRVSLALPLMNVSARDRAASGRARKRKQGLPANGILR